MNHNVDSSNRVSRAANGHKSVQTHMSVPIRTSAAKPLSAAELQARTNGQIYLELAQSYRANSDVLNAISCCLEGLELTSGISRPLMVRDQLHDLLAVLDPSDDVSQQIKMCIHHRASMSAIPDDKLIRIEHKIRGTFSKQSPVA